MPNPFAYAELHTQNPEAAKDFYRRLLDWRLDDHVTPRGSYTEIDPGEGFPGGLLSAAPGEASSHWMTYILVDDLAASTAKAKELGARGIKELVEVPGQGRYSIFDDPTGARFGLWQKTAG